MDLLNFSLHYKNTLEKNFMEKRMKKDSKELKPGRGVLITKKLKGGVPC